MTAKPSSPENLVITLGRPPRKPRSMRGKTRQGKFPMNPFRLFREWKTRREVREGVKAFDALGGQESKPWPAPGLEKEYGIEVPLPSEEDERLERKPADPTPEDIDAMPRCNSCKWWSNPACSHCAEEFPGFGQCNAANPEVAEVTHDGELLTAPDFGCVQWKRRDDE